MHQEAIERKRDFHNIDWQKSRKQYLTMLQAGNNACSTCLCPAHLPSLAAHGLGIGCHWTMEAGRNELKRAASFLVGCGCALKLTRQ